MATPRPYSTTGYIPNGTPTPTGAGHLPPGAVPLLPNQGRIVQTGPFRILCIADVRGNLRSLNDLAKQAKADHVIHTGDFGFYDNTSLERIAEKTLKHVAQYSPLIPDNVKKSIQAGGNGPVKNRFTPEQLPLSELPQLIDGVFKLDVPVYTVWGACEDVRVLEKFRSNEYKVHNLHIIDEAQSRLLELGGVKLRLLGLGGAVVMHKLFDNGEGRTTIAGGQGTMWTTLLQMGELIDTAHRVYDPTETRVFVTHASPAREGILNQLSVTLKADFSISAGLHFRYGSSYNEFSVNPTLDHYRGKLAASKASFNDVWETVKSEVEPAIQGNEAQQNLLRNALDIVEKMPTTAAGGNPFGNTSQNPPALGQVDESAFKNMWNFNLADAAFGWLVLEIQEGRIGTEMKAQGFNFAHRGAKQSLNSANANTTASSTAGAQGTSPALAPAVPKPAVNGTSSPASPRHQAPTPVPPAVPAAAQNSTPAPAPAKPGTPQPERTRAHREERNGAGNGIINGNGNVNAGGEKTAPQDIIGLFIMNVNSDEQVLELLAPQDHDKVKIEKWGNSNKVVQFKTVEERDGAMGRISEDYKTRTAEDRSRPLVKIFIHRDSAGSGKGFNARGGAGTWGSSRQGNGKESGYRSAGGNGASDSESNTRRGPRGGARGGRGGEKGHRGGRRGGMKEGVLES